MLAAVVLMVGVFLIDSGAYTVVRFVVSILALIVAVYAVQGRRWAPLLPLVAVAVLWNPVFPFTFAGTWWSAAHVLAAAALVAVGLFLRIPNPAATVR